MPLTFNSNSLACRLHSRPAPIISYFGTRRAPIRSCRCGCRSNSTCSCSCCAHFSSSPSSSTLKSNIVPSSTNPRSIPTFASHSARALHSRASSITTSATRLRHVVVQPFDKPGLYFRHTRALATMAQEYKLKDITSFAEIPAFEKRECEVEGIQDGKVLVIKYDGQVHALSPRCTHYGAPLKLGVVAPNGRITCPWHGGMSLTFWGADREHAKKLLG